MSRDPDAAKAKAQEGIDRARRIAEAVEQYHGAADEIDRAQVAIATASASRVAALHAMRDAGLSVADMAQLTGLSASRIQALVRGIPQAKEETAAEA